MSSLKLPDGVELGDHFAGTERPEVTIADICERTCMRAVRHQTEQPAARAVTRSAWPRSHDNWGACEQLTVSEKQHNVGSWW